MKANINKKILSHNFSRAAHEYSDLALVQKDVAAKLCSLVKHKIRTDSKILDLGCGTGFIRNNLHHSHSSIFECDISFEMLNNSVSDIDSNLKVQCDFSNLPFRKNSFDVLISSFSLQWLDNFADNFRAFHSLLKPNGLFAIALPIKQSLKELKSYDLFTINDFPSLEMIKDSCKKSGFTIINLIEEKLTQEFNSPISAIKFIKNIGANNLAEKPKFITKKQFLEFDSFCLKNFSNKNKNFDVSWNIIYILSTKN